MEKYFVLLKTDATKTRDLIQTLRTLPKQPFNGIQLYYTMNCFGTWDVAIWFEAENQDYANDFVGKKIRPIPGVLEAYTVPTTPIKEYVNWE